MHILMLHQYFSTEANKPESRLFEVGRRLVSQGHQVTVITTNSRLELPLGKKKIGLLQKEGVAVVAFNLDYSPQMKPGAKRHAFMAFARQASGQGRRLPRPDLVLASSPPLTVAMPALSLSRCYRVPLVIEIRELWPDAVVQRGTISGKTLISLSRRLEQKTYRRAARIIATCRGIAEAIRECAVDEKKISVIPAGLCGDELFAQFSRVLEGI